MDRRDNSGHMKEILIPLIVAIVIGSVSAYVVAVKVLERVQTQIIYIEKDSDEEKRYRKEMLSAINENQNQLIARGEWIKNTNQRINRLEKYLIK